jgi:hypothetical protein
MTSEQILKATTPGEIFSIENIEKQHIQYIKKFHPDHGGSNEVFIKIQELYKEGLELIESGCWKEPGRIRFKTTTGTLFLNPIIEKTFELGIYYILKNSIVYIIDKNKEKYARNYMEKVFNLDFIDDKMEETIKPCIPAVKSHGKLEDGRYFLIVKKEEDTIPLSEVQKQLADEEYSKHFLWFVSRLQKLCCFLSLNNLVHNGFVEDSIFVNPRFHIIVIIGGWFYTCQIGEKMIGCPRQVYEVMPPKNKNSKIADCNNDLEAIKAIGRKVKNLPPKINNFFNCGSKNDPFEELKKWDIALDKSVKRSFRELKIDKTKLFK